MIELETRIRTYVCRQELHHIFFNYETIGNLQQQVEFESDYGHRVSVELNGLPTLKGDHDTKYFITIETEKERNEMLNEVKVQTISIYNCARCGGTHKDLEIKKLSNSDYSHWAPCPTNGEPVLIKFEKIEKEEIYDTIP